MKRFLLLFLFVLVFLFSLSKVNASSCSNEEIVKLKKSAAKIKATYEEKEGEYPEGMFVDTETGESAKEIYYYFDVTFSNITKDYYVVYKDNISNNESTVRFSDLTDGLYSFQWLWLSKVASVTYDVYTSSETKCPDEKVYTGHLVLPKYNDMSDIVLCQYAAELPECKRYITEEYNYETQHEAIEKYVEKKLNAQKELKWYQKVGQFMKKHWIITTGGTILIIAGVATVIVKKKREGSDNI